MDPKQDQCYMQAVAKESVSENEELLKDGVHNETSESGYNELLFFYFECQQESGTHEPNLCVVQNEAGDEWVFEGDNTRNEFCECLFTKGHEGCIVMAHNSRDTMGISFSSTCTKTVLFLKLLCMVQRSYQCMYPCLKSSLSIR